ncbi:signal peptide peptidase SppA [Tistlia consotensis]|uniref:Signal peptide peptidase SppA n=1 Tax=Tistlia consotensis USBA 355 TaxID=560819 RepID=A0A1Y6B3F5_9PROT|nr:S49 family peptidase [Tistlia consotensis]SME89511.1 signal peptide peptidase SppA [Tistlia consotensis USBA 355]SNR26032.1 signal peptide peptidase SppA [Tistlia consotensis]
MDRYKLLSWLPLKRFREPPPVVSVLRLDGGIGPGGTLRRGLNLKSLAGPIERAFQPKRLAAVALVINSPGGSAAQSALIAKRIRQWADEKQVPVIAFVEDAAASGGYWLACAADEIYADEASIVGSIGVIFAGFGFVGLIDKLGVERRVHTAGTRKAILDPFRPENPADVETLKTLQAEIHEGFKAYVRERRGPRLKGGDELFTGEFWTGRRAFELGLVDGLGDIRSQLRARFGEKVQLRAAIRERRGLSRLLRPGLDTSELASDLLAVGEERLLWSRFGL